MTPILTLTTIPTSMKSVKALSAVHLQQGQEEMYVLVFGWIVKVCHIFSRS